MVIDSSSSQEIERELAAVLSSKSFKNSPILSAFLRFVVMQTLAGKENEIKEYTVGLHVLGKPANFNPLADASVRIHAVRLRKLLADYYQANNEDGKLQILLPKGAYKPIFISRSNEAGVGPHPASGAKTLTQADQSVGDHICVLPFSGFINHEAIDFSVELFSEQLSEQLSLFEDISVISYHDISYLVKQGIAAGDLHRQLGVAFYIAGNVEVEGADMLVNVQLFDAQRNLIVWSHTYPRRLSHTSPMEVGNSIIRHVVSSLAGYTGMLHYQRYTARATVPALTNKKAMAAYWFYYFQTHQSPESFQEAFRQIRGVVEFGEENALCWAVLAHMHIQGIVYNYPTVADPLSAAKALVARALAVDANCQQAYVTMAWINIFLRKKEEVIHCLDRCDEINPNNTYFKAVCCFGYALAGDYEKCRIFQEQSMELNPLPFAWLALPGVFMALRQHDYEKMLFHARKIGASGGIHQYLFELIALFYLDDKVAAAPLLDTYLKKYPQGLDHALKAWSTIILDEELVQQITIALQELKQLAQHTRFIRQPQ